MKKQERTDKTPRIVKTENGLLEYVCTKCDKIGLRHYTMMQPRNSEDVPHICESCKEEYYLPPLNEK